MIAIAVTLHSAPVLAQDAATKNAAREFAQRGKDSYEREEYEKARDLFQRAYALIPAPTLSLGEARALEKLGLLVEAVEAYVRTVRTEVNEQSPRAFIRAVREAEKELSALRPRVPQLNVRVEGAAEGQAYKVTVDGKELPGAMLGVLSPHNPGKHTVAVQAEGGSEDTKRVTLAEGESESVVLTVQPFVTKNGLGSDVKAPPASPALDSKAQSDAGAGQRTVGYVALGVGAAGLATGVVTGLMATSEHETATEQCPDGRCTAGSSGADAVDSFRTLRTISSLTYGVAGVGIAAGIALILMAPDPSEDQHVTVQPYIGPHALGFVGRF